MRIISLHLHLLSAAVLLSLPSWPQTNRTPPGPPSITGSAVIEGRVLDAITGVGVPDVPLTIFLTVETTSFTEQYPVRTDALGAFRLKDLPAGRFFTNIKSNDYVATDLPQRDTELADGEHRRIDIQVRTPGSLSGHTLDRDGDPLPGALVEVYRDSIDITGQVRIAYGSGGTFRVTNIPPGEIRLRAVPPEGVIPVETEEGRLVAVPTYYPKSVNLAGAAPITVLSREKPAAYDIETQERPAFRVRGEVRAPNGRLAPGATVSLFPVTQGPQMLTIPDFLKTVRRSSGFGEKAQSVTTGEDGAFVFDLVPVGDWYVAATVKGDADPEDYAVWRRAHASGTEKIRVSRGDVDRLAIQTRHPVPIDIRARELPPGVPETFRPTLQGEVPLEPNELPHTGGDPKPAEGFATRAELAPGSYYLSISSTPNTYPAEILVNGSPAVQPLTISGPTQIEVVYRPRDAVLRGRIRGAEDRRAVAIFVLPQADLTPTIAPLRQANDGGYRIENLAPGTYYVLAAGATTLRTPEQIRERGKRVQLRAGATLDLDLNFVHLDSP